MWKLLVTMVLVANIDVNAVEEVVPYRCLVHEYEADALMGCYFGHLHDEDLCLSQD